MNRLNIKVRDPFLLLPILPLLAAGESNREIGAVLFLSEDAVKNRIASLLEVLDARNRTHAVSLAHQSGLLTDKGDLAMTVELAADYARRLAEEAA